LYHVLQKKSREIRTKSKNLLLPHQSTEKETSAIAIGKTRYRPMIIRAVIQSSWMIAV
jgi:hypothetical protein